jgi:histidinol-phosphatase (PHP family)
VCKSVHNPSHAPVLYSKHREITDAILQELVKRGKGMEINTSGVDRAGDYLPSEAFLRRFKELGGEIVTVGSDAHDPSRVGQYVPQALQLLKDIFGHVCTFQNRQPVFHKL